MGQTQDSGEGYKNDNNNIYCVSVFFALSIPFLFFNPSDEKIKKEELESASPSISLYFLFFYRIAPMKFLVLINGQLFNVLKVMYNRT